MHTQVIRLLATASLVFFVGCGSDSYEAPGTNASSQPTSSATPKSSANPLSSAKPSSQSSVQPVSSASVSSVSSSSAVSSKAPVSSAAKSSVMAPVSSAASSEGVIAPSSSSTAQSVSSQSASGINGKDGDYALLAWCDLGMHCMDEDYSVFSILPPFNNLHAQIKMRRGGLLTSGITLTYEAAESANGVLNTTSILDDNNLLKTEFWKYEDQLFGVDLTEDFGLTGNAMQSTTPQAMQFNANHGWWEATGIPITPIDDNGKTNYYPRVKVVAKNMSGEVLAEAVTVLPVSDEMDCRVCHNSLTGYATPDGGFVNDPDPAKDYKRNILRLHDEARPKVVENLMAKLTEKGYNYDPAGLEATQAAGTPILCAACHRSNALPGTGVEGIIQLTQAIHARHARVVDPSNGMQLDDVSNRSACYLCHPGSETECLRGAMGTAKNPDGTSKMDCQSCHGNMSHVGNGREGWLDQPNCQACHQNGKRHTSAIENGTLREALDKRFATDADTPAPGFSLYRFSKGHKDLNCESCHGATHAIYPSHEAGDNLMSIGLQGHSGTVGECKACHANVPLTQKGGPHGLHTLGQTWIKEHGQFAETDNEDCAACHGSNFTGSKLSATMNERNFMAFGRPVTYTKGQPVSCYDCHNGPDGPQ